VSAFIGPTKVFSHLGRLTRWAEGDRSAPVTVEWDLSNRCYLGCEACHFAHTHTRGPWTVQDRRLPMAWDGTGDLADIVMVKRALLEMAAAGVQGVVFSGGGEPTTHPQWTEAVQSATDCGIEVGMYTAGGLLTSDSAKILADSATWVVVSLDAADPETYAAEKRVKGDQFPRAVAGIRAISGRKARIGVSFLMHAKNWRQMWDFRDFARHLGADYVTFRPRIDTSPDDPGTITSDRHWIDAALPLLRDMSTQVDVECDPDRFLAYRHWEGHGYSTCHGIKLNATVTPDGRVWVCLQRRGVQGSSIGNLTTTTFREIWANHPGVWTDFRECRAMCRLHLVNQQLAEVFAPRQHTAFV
jgi:MoaA/NifB/PqqE/SkfB family radical SAM enzyme